MRWCKKAADLGNTTAMFVIGVFYQFGKGVPEDEAQSAGVDEEGGCNGRHRSQHVAERSSVTLLTALLAAPSTCSTIVKQIVDAKAQFRSLAEAWADTGTSTGRLMIAVLGGLADVERDLIRTRTAEGRSRAKAQGQHMGRPPALTPTQKKEASRRRAQGATLDELARSYNVGISTIRRVTASR